MKSDRDTVDELGLNAEDYEQLVALYKRIEAQSGKPFAHQLVTEAAVAVQVGKVDRRSQLIAEKVARLVDAV